MNIFGKGSIRGFTLIELIVVIAVIGILAGITVIGMGRFQADTRDAKRVSSTTAIVEALEKYYDANGEYPSCSAISSDGQTLTSNTLKELTQTTLVSPQASSDTSNSLSCSELTLNGSDIFQYQGDGSASCETNVACLQYTIRYKDESENRIISINSRRTTDIATSGAITNLTAAPGFITASLNWSAIANATQYTVQSATDINFTANTQQLVATTNTLSVTGLNSGTQYHFRVAPNNTATNATGVWSNRATTTTLTLAAPTGSVVANSTSQLTYSWSDIATAVYTVEYSTSSAVDGNGNFTVSPNVLNNITTPRTRIVTGLPTGTTLFFHVRATLPNTVQSDWSATVSGTTIINPPAAYTITPTRTWNNLRAVSNAICPAGTVGDYRWTANGNLWQSGTAFQTVDFPIGWGGSATLAVQTRCAVGATVSGYVAANNTEAHSLSNPSAWAGTIAWRTAGWGGSCPTYTTSQSFYWRVIANDFGWSASGWTGSGSSYARTGSGWGDGAVRATIYCSGPWGQVTAGAWGPFGSGCVPNIIYPNDCYADI